MSLIAEINKLYASELNSQEFVRAAYRTILLRDPDPEGLLHNVSRKRVDVIDSLLQSTEYRGVSRSGISSIKSSSTKRQLLLIGAYSNGNIGDAIQAASVKNHALSINPELEIWACSDQSGTFPYDYARVLPARYLKRPDIINKFAAVVVGGGGLLAHPHAPLSDEDWQKSLKIPTILLSIGAEPHIASKSELLISSSVYVSGRDRPSVNALELYNNNVKRTADPVLCDPTYILDRSLSNKKVGKLFILKRMELNELEAARAIFDVENDRVCFIEPALDWPVWRIFPEATSISDVSELVALIDNSEMVISTRYHGCILAACRRTPFIAIREQKSNEICKMLKVEGSFVEKLSKLPGQRLVAHHANYGVLVEEQKILRSGLTEAFFAAGLE